MFLSLRGQPYRLVRGEGDIAVWEFDKDAVAPMVEAHDNGTSAVEPKAHFHAITKTRRMMFDFINSGDKAWDEAKIADHAPTGKRP